MKNEIQTIINQLLLNDGSGDAQLASTAQKLLKSKRQADYMVELDEFIKKTEDEIESICNENHHVRSLLLISYHLCNILILVGICLLG